MENKEYILKSESVKKALITMVIPSVIAGAINQLNVIIDTFFLGNYAMYSTEAQTATATSMTVVLMMTALSIMVAIGSSVTCSQLLGKGKKEIVNRYMANSFVYGWILYALLLLVLLPILPSFVSFLTGANAGDIVYDNSIIYTRIMLLFFPTVVFMQLSSQTIRAEGQSVLIVKVATIQVIINIIVNFVLISDTFSAISFHGTNYEAAGAALGTAISQLFMAVALLAVLFNKNKTNYYINLKNVKFTKDWFTVLRNGIPQFMANLFFSLGIFLVGVSITLVSNNLDYSMEESVNLQAASGISVRVIMMMFLLLNGGVQGIQGFVAYQYGSKSTDRLSESLIIVRKAAMVIGLVMFFVFFVGSGFIAELFTTNDKVIELVSLSNKAFAVAILFFPTAHSMFGLFASIGKPKLAVLCTVFRDGILLSGFALLLPFLFDDTGVMIVMPCALLLGSIVIMSIGIKVFKNFHISN